MGIKIVVRGLCIALLFFSSSAAFSDILSGSGTAAFQNWNAGDLNQNGAPYWDQTSMDGDNHNIGFYLTGAPSTYLPGAPGALPFWGSLYDASTDIGGGADLNFLFEPTAATSTVNLEMEVAGESNVNQFGWYDIASPSVLHPLFVGHDSAPATNSFSPSAEYGFYLTTLGGVTFYTQSSLNSGAETNHQHFAVFEESLTSGQEIYWLGIEDSNATALQQEGYIGDYNDMLVKITALSPPNEIPEPSTVVLVVSGLLVTVLRRKRR